MSQRHDRRVVALFQLLESTVLTHFNVEHQVIENFGIHGITFDQLRFLGDGDLEELGIVNENQRALMLDDFQNYYNPDRYALKCSFPSLLTLDFFRRHPPGGYPRRELSVIDFINQQLRRLDILLAASIISINANRAIVHAPGIVLHNNHQQFFSPEAVLHLLSLLSNRIADMHVIVANLRDENAINRIFRRIQRNKMKRKLFAFGFGVLMFGAGVLIHRRFGAK